MKIENFRRVVRLAGLILPLSWIPSAAQAQARGESFGVSVRTASMNYKATSVVSPTAGGQAEDQASAVLVESMVRAQDAFSVAGAETDGKNSDAVSSATLGGVDILDGLITADGVVAIASSTSGDRNADGSGFINLVVNGVTMTDAPANTRVDLPGVGYVVLNEQSTKGGGMTVNMIHVVMQNSGSKATTGEIIVASASSR